ncbi:unnamed protein product, partial [Menidia menidia]
MADEEETREVLFPDWEGPDKTGLTIEHTTGGEIFVKEVKGESPAARSGKVYEGDQIVGATIYFDNMSSEETSDLLKTLNKHKVGLKLQNKGDKSPCYSPLSTPCRSPMGTLTWEGKAHFGGSSPDIILSGDDEDYRRIYTKKIKPRLKSEDLAEGVDVRTERHSSTSSDGSTITTITRRITTYTVDMPSGISEKPEISSPELKRLRHESGEGSPSIRIVHGSPSGKVELEEGVFESRFSTLPGMTSATDMDVNLTSSTLTIGDHVSLPSTKPETENIKRPNFDIEGTETKLKDPRFNMSSILGPKLSMPDVDINLKGPKLKGHADMSAPKIEGDVKTPDIDIKGPKVGSKGRKDGYETPQMKMPSFNIKGPKVEAPDLDVNLKGQVFEGKVTVPVLEGSVESPDVRIKGPDINIEGHKGGIKMPKLKFEGDADLSAPKIKQPDIEIKGPKVDIEGPKGGFEMPKIKMPSLNIKGSKDEGEVDVKVLKLDGKADLPKVDIEGRDIDSESQKGGFKMPKMKMPSFNMKGPKLESPEVDVNLPKVNIDAEGHGVEIKGKDIDIEGPNAKHKGFKYNMPSISGPNLPMPDGDFKFKHPKLKGDVDLSITKTEGDIKTPEMDIKGPNVNNAGPKGGFEMPKMKMPSLNIKSPKVDASEMEINLKGPKIKGDADVKVPKIEGNVELPEVDIEGPDFDIEGHKGGFKMPKFKMPSFGMKGPKLEGPEVDVDLPKANIDVGTPDVEMKGPDVDIEGPNANLKGPKFNMPSISGPKLSMPDVDFNLKGSKVKGDVDLSATKVDGDLKTPDIDFKGPKVDIEGPKGGFEMPKIKMPSLNIKGPKVEAPDLDFNLKGPKMKGDVDVKVPKIEGKVELPEVDIEGPDIDIESHKGGYKMPKFKMPSFGMKGPKLEGPDVNVELPKANMDVGTSDVDIKGLDVDIEGPNAKLKGPKFNMPSISGPKLSMPDVDFNLKGPKFKGDVDMSAPKIE